jgi:hypothetical protein
MPKLRLLDGATTDERALPENRLDDGLDASRPQRTCTNSTRITSKSLRRYTCPGDFRVHGADLGVHASPIFAFTLARFSRSRSADAGKHASVLAGVERIAEAFAKTFKRDNVYLAKLSDAESVFVQLGAWFEDYNDAAPHKGLGMLSRRAWRRKAA